MCFWNNWENKTSYEKKIIITLLNIKNFLKNKFFENIYCIFVGGSFQRREYTIDSDVDVWIIVNKDSNIEKIKTLLRQQFKEEIKILKQEPNLISLETLRRGTYLTKIKNKMSPRRFVLLSYDYSLIYGKPLPYNELKKMTNNQAYEGIVKFILNNNLEDFNNREASKLYLYMLYYKYKEKYQNLVYSFKTMRSLLEKYDEKLGIKCLDCIIKNLKYNNLKDEIISSLKE